MVVRKAEKLLRRDTVPNSTPPRAYKALIVPNGFPDDLRGNEIPLTIVDGKRVKTRTDSIRG